MSQRPVFSLRFLIAVLACVWCLGFLVGPLLDSSPGGFHVTTQLYGRVCHQDPARSFHWLGIQWAVCHRCSAIYLSFTLGALFLAFWRGSERLPIPSPRVVSILLIPIVLDAVLDFVGIRSADMYSRVLTGALAGGTLAWLVIPLFEEAVRQLRSPLRSQTAGERHA